VYVPTGAGNNRMIGCYLDYSTLVLDDPQHFLFTDGYFLFAGMHATVQYCIRPGTVTLHPCSVSTTLNQSTNQPHLTMNSYNVCRAVCRDRQA
jgi:hypothetical protein